MVKYKQPEMEIIEFATVDTITDSNHLYKPGSNTGGDEGQLGWDDL